MSTTKELQEKLEKAEKELREVKEQLAAKEKEETKDWERNIPKDQKLQETVIRLLVGRYSARELIEIAFDEGYRFSQEEKRPKLKNCVECSHAKGYDQLDGLHLVCSILRISLNVNSSGERLKEFYYSGCPLKGPTSGE